MVVAARRGGASYSETMRPRSLGKRVGACWKQCSRRLYCDNLVLHFFSAQTRPDWYVREGRTPPRMRLPFRVDSLIVWFDPLGNKDPTVTRRKSPQLSHVVLTLGGGQKVPWELLHPPYRNASPRASGVPRSERNPSTESTCEGATRSEIGGHPSAHHQGSCTPHQRLCRSSFFWPYESVFLCKVKQPQLQRLSSTMQSRHDGSDGNIEDFGDFFIGKPFDVGQ